MNQTVEPLGQVEDIGGTAQPLLQVSGLTKHFPVRGDLFSARKTVRAVDDVSFSIAKGETVGIVGESGCGKSTTARLLMHLMKRDAGDIVYDGPLIDDAYHSDVSDYIATLERLERLPVSVVHGGHFPSFGQVRFRQLIRDYLAGHRKPGCHLT